jgi:O-antigen ligase
MLWDPVEKVHIFMGYGAGSTHPGATALSSEGQVRPPGVSYEEELGRAIIELGLIGGALFFALKLWILWMTWDGMRRAQNSWEDILCMTAFIVAFLHLGVEKIVFNHIGGSIYWLCAGAALWVWCRRSREVGNS